MSKSWVYAIRDKKVSSLVRQGMTLNEIAEQLHYSPSQIRRVVKQLMSPEEYQLFKANNREKAAINRKYTLWDGSKIEYNKNFPESLRSFRLRYNGKSVNIGNFHDFVSIEIIHDLINQFTE